MATVTMPAEQRFRLSDISWPTYVTYSDGLGPRHVRVTYDQGEMELMTLSFEHESAKTLLGLMVAALAEEVGMDMAGGGSMTCRQEERARGFEPDECYWIVHEEAVRDRTEIDFTRDPPPDLAIEVEISRSTINRLRLYASLGVPELWRWDGQRLRVGFLQESGEYRDSDRSLAFPFLPFTELVRFLTLRGRSQLQIVREFRQWVREQQAIGWSQSKKKGNGGKGPSKGRRKPK